MYALADPSDQFHLRATRELTAIQESAREVAIPYPTLCEAHTLVLRRLGWRYARQWMSEVVGGAALLNPDAADYIAAAKELERYSDQRITLVDSVVATLSARLSIPVWSFDRHFEMLRSAVLKFPLD